MTGRGYLWEDRNGSGEARGGPVQVGEPSGRTRTSRRNLGEVWDGLGIPRGGSGRVGDPRRGPGLVGRPSRRSGTGRVHYGKSRMGRGTTGRSKTGWRSLGEVRDGSVDPRGGPELVGRPSQRSRTGRVCYGKSRMGRGTTGRTGTVRGTHGEVRDGSVDPRGTWDGSEGTQGGPRRVAVTWGGPARVGGHSGRSRTGLGTLEEVLDGSRGPRGGL